MENNLQPTEGIRIIVDHAKLTTSEQIIADVLAYLNDELHNDKAETTPWFSFNV